VTPGRVYVKGPTVRLWHADPELLEGLAVAARIFGRHGLPCVVTSFNDSDHRTNSLHFEGRAMDLRSKHAPEAERETILSHLRSDIDSAFGSGRWDILLESRGTDNEHYHLEIDPKT
jgi:hypothetical protein